MENYRSPVIDRDTKLEIRFNYHPHRRNNFIVAAMHAMYCSGKSLQEIATTYKKTRQSIYDVFRSRGYKLRSKVLKPFIEIDGRKFTKRNDGYWRATSGDRKQLHIYIWEKQNGQLPARHGIHHKDLDRSNNNIENLECLSIQEISSNHNPHHNQFTKN